MRGGRKMGSARRREAFSPQHQRLEIAQADLKFREQELPNWRRVYGHWSRGSAQAKAALSAPGREGHRKNIQRLATRPAPRAREAIGNQ